MLVELAVGYPAWLVRRAGHPVTWMGHLIAWLDTRLNDPAEESAARRRAGRIALALLLLVVGASAFLLETALLLLPFGLLLIALAASTLIAQRSLHGHVAAVADALETSTLAEARTAVSQIVGRDTTQLDEAGVVRAAIESLAENFSDGIVSPVFWLGLAGLTGGAVYKAINTADSTLSVSRFGQRIGLATEPRGHGEHIHRGGRRGHPSGPASASLCLPPPPRLRRAGCG